MSKKRNIVLGSSSKSRRQLMDEWIKATDFYYSTESPDIDEKSIGMELRENNKAEELVLAIALAKTEALLTKIDFPCILITCDQVIVHNGIIREKPNSKEQCFEYLNSYADHPAVSYCALVVTNTENGKQMQGVDKATQFFKPIPLEIIKELISKGDIMHCAGGFMIDDGKLLKLIKKFYFHI
jgi:septum formation protein